MIRTAPTAAETEASLVEAMLGRPLDVDVPAEAPPPPDAPVVLTVAGAARAGRRRARASTLRAGEILGLAGLVGAGRTELARALFGAARVAVAAPSCWTRRPLGRSPSRSLRAGLAMIPESRKDEGLIFGRSVDRERDALAARRAQPRSASSAARASEAPRSDDARALRRPARRHTPPVRALSGGNQQKVLLARTLLCEPHVLIADEPTRGVDVGAKRAIYDFLAELAADGLGVLLISSELEEILGLAHRVLVMRRGRIVAELDGERSTRTRSSRPRSPTSRAAA